MTSPTPGSLAEEARRLAEALSEWGRTHGGPLAGLGRAYAGPLSDWAKATAARTPEPPGAEPPTAEPPTAGPPGAGPTPGPFYDWPHHREGGPHDEPRSGGRPADSAGRPAECRYCPVCQLIAMLRGDRPEAAGRVAAAGTALMEALRDVLVPPADPPEGPPPTVQHIDVD